MKSCLAWFTQQNVLDFHPCCSMYQFLVTFSFQITFHFMLHCSLFFHSPSDGHLNCYYEYCHTGLCVGMGFPFSGKLCFGFAVAFVKLSRRLFKDLLYLWFRFTTHEGFGENVRSMIVQWAGKHGLRIVMKIKLHIYTKVNSSFYWSS